MQELLLVLFVIVAVALVGLILIQHGKGADMGASFGSGSSNTVFGSSGSGNFLTRATSGLAAAFMALSLVLGFMASRQVNDPHEINVDVPTPVVNNTAPVVAPVAKSVEPAATQAQSAVVVATPAEAAKEPVKLEAPKATVPAETATTTTAAPAAK